MWAAAGLSDPEMQESPRRGDLVCHTHELQRHEWNTPSPVLSPPRKVSRLWARLAKLPWRSSLGSLAPRQGKAVRKPPPHSHLSGPFYKLPDAHVHGGRAGGGVQRCQNRESEKRESERMRDRGSKEGWPCVGGCERGLRGRCGVNETVFVEVSEGGNVSGLLCGPGATSGGMTNARGKPHSKCDGSRRQLPFRVPATRCDSAPLGWARASDGSDGEAGSRITDTVVKDGWLWVRLARVQIRGSAPSRCVIWRSYLTFLNLSFHIS